MTARRCAFDPDCDRAPIPTTPDGRVYANCFAHHEQLVPSWHAQARAHVLRPAIVGGLPIDARDPVPGAPDPRLSPQPVTGRVPESASALPSTRQDDRQLSRRGVGGLPRASASPSLPAAVLATAPASRAG